MDLLARGRGTLGAGLGGVLAAAPEADVHPRAGTVGAACVVIVTANDYSVMAWLWPGELAPGSGR